MSTGLKITRQVCKHHEWWCGAWGYTVQEVQAADADVTALTIDQLIKEFSVTGFDYVKIDIEGSERVILSDRSHAGWLAGCKLASVEIHGGAATESIVRSFFIDSEFESFSYGEYEVFKRRTS